MTEKQLKAIEVLLLEWYCEICDECEFISVARGSSEIAQEIKNILDNLS